MSLGWILAAYGLGGAIVFMAFAFVIAQWPEITEFCRDTFTAAGDDGFVSPTAARPTTA